MSKVQTFGAFLRENRRVRGISQRALAEEVGIDHTYLSKVENDQVPYTPSEDLVVRIANALGLDPDYALHRAGKVASDVIEAVAANPELAKQIRKAAAA